MRLLLACLMALTMVNEARAEVTDGKTYRIVPDGNAQASLFVKNASKDAQTPVVVWTETHVPAQQWSAIADGEGKMLLKNVYTGMYLDISNGALVQTGNGAGWIFEPVDEANNDYCLLHDQYLGVTSTVDGEQPKLGLQMMWHFEEVEPQLVFDEKARQRMLDGFLTQYVQDKGNGYRTFNNGGWNEAETLEAVLDFYEATGDRKYLNIFEACYDYMRYHVGTRWDGGTTVGGYDWFGYDFNDDVMWMIIAAARAYLITGKMSYLNDAKRNFDLIWERAYLGYVGLLRWAESSGDRNGANSCVNGPAEVAACYIAIGTGDESYFEKARELYANQRKYLFEPYTGKVYDSVTFNPNDLSLKDRNTWASTYNQGTMLGGALLLYRHYGDEQYKTDATRIIAYAKSALCNSNGLVRVCQNADGDFQGFKGILMRYAGMYAMQFEDAEYQAWITANAFHAYNNINSKGFGHSAWLTKAAEDMRFGNVDYSRPGSAFGATTALTAACAVTLQNRLGASFGYEAENAQTTGSAVVKTDDQSGGQYVSGLDHGNGMLRFNCQIPADGDYLMDVYYLSYQSRNLQVTIGNSNYTLTCPSVSTWDRIADEGKATLKVSLKEGQCFCILTNPNGTAPNIDRIAFTKIVAGDAAKVVLRAADAEKVGNDNITFHYEAEQDGHYLANVFYSYGERRNVYLAVNDADAVVSVFESSGEAMVRRPLFVTLRKGNNTMLFSAEPSLPEIDRVEVSSLGLVDGNIEAEYASTSGQVAIVDDNEASGGRYLNYIGNGNNNLALFRYDAAYGGNYNLEVTYFTNQTRQMYVRANNGTKVNTVFESTGGWKAGTAQKKTVKVTLKTGINVIVLGSDSGWAPCVDKISLSPAEESAVRATLAQPSDGTSCYTLAGIAVNRPSQRGIYIKNNQKFVSLHHD